MSLKFKNYSFYLLTSWTVFIILSVVWNVYQTRNNTVERALIEARTIFDHNIAYKKWNILSGGIYYPVNSKNKPDPHIVAPNRDITTTKGEKLTLVNHFQMTKQAYEYLQLQSPLPALNRTVSMKPLNPENMPDEWEKKALLAFEKGHNEISEITKVKGEPYLRVLKPYVTTVDECLKCHGFQGYKIGDIRGGVSIAVPMKSYYEGEAKMHGTIAVTHLLLWLVGMAGIFVLTKNIEKKQREISESELKFRTLSEFAYDWEYWVTKDKKVVFMSPSCERITGYTQQEFMDNEGLIEDILHPEDKDLFISHLNDFQTSRHVEMEFRITTKEGTIKWLSHACEPIDIQGKFLGRRVSNRDITDKKIAQMRLAASIKEWKDTFDSIEDSIVILNPNNRIIKANIATSRLLGLSLEEIIGKPCYKVFHKIESHCKGCPHLKTLESRRSELLVLESEALNRTFEITTTPILDIWLAVTGTIHITKDITDRKKLEDQLIQSQKMESLGLLAGGMAHDFNNLLTAITGYSSMLQEELKESEGRVQRYIGHVLNASEKAQNLTSSLLAFSRKQIIKPRAVSLNEVIKTISSLLERLIGEDIEFRIKCSDEEFLIFADHHQIEQVIMNLITNAKDAMHSGGRLSIETTPVILTSEFTTQHNALPGRYMVLSVSDTGAGMDKKDLAYIFEPFFTTKSKGKGTGLGLSIVYGIVKQHDGFINVYSEKGIGTTFKLYLPAADTNEIGYTEQNRVAEGPRENLTGDETILIAEDEESVREFLKDILRSYGYSIIVAEDGQDAIEKYNEHRDCIDMIILDVVMPRKNGKDVYNLIKEIKPDLKALFISGYTQDILTSKGIYEDGLEFIAKPLEIESLMIKIRAILNKSNTIQNP